MNYKGRKRKLDGNTDRQTWHTNIPEHASVRYTSCRGFDPNIQHRADEDTRDCNRSYGGNYTRGGDSFRGGDGFHGDNPSRIRDGYHSDNSSFGDNRIRDGDRYCRDNSSCGDDRICDGDAYRSNNISFYGDSRIHDGDSYHSNKGSYGDNHDGRGCRSNNRSCGDFPRQRNTAQRDLEDTSEISMDLECRKEYSHPYKQKGNHDQGRLGHSSKRWLPDDQRQSRKQLSQSPYKQNQLPYGYSSKLSDRGRQKSKKMREKTQTAAWVGNNIHKIRNSKSQYRNISRTPRHMKNIVKNLGRKPKPKNEKNDSERDIASCILVTLCQKFDGHCHLVHLKQDLEAAGIGQFSNSNDLKRFLEKFPNSFKTEIHGVPDEEEGEVVEDATADQLQVTATPKLILCIDHSTKAGSCTEDCGGLHICKYSILSSCEFEKGPTGKCIFGHNLKSRHNEKVRRKALLHQFPALDLVTSRLKYRNHTTMPVICKFHNSRRKNCSNNRCQYLHICKEFVENDCRGMCGRLHYIRESDEVLSRYGLSHHNSAEVLARLRQIYTTEEQIQQTIRRNSSTPDRTGRQNFLQLGFWQTGQSKVMEELPKTSEGRPQIPEWKSIMISDEETSEHKEQVSEKQESYLENRNMSSEQESSVQNRNMSSEHESSVQNRTMSSEHESSVQNSNLSSEQESSLQNRNMSSEQESSLQNRNMSSEQESSLQNRNMSSARNVHTDECQKTEISQHEAPLASTTKNFMLEKILLPGDDCKASDPVSMKHQSETGLHEGVSACEPRDVSGPPTEWTWSLQTRGKEEWNEIGESISLEKKFRKYLKAKETSFVQNNSTSKIDFSRMDGKMEEGTTISLKRIRKTRMKDEPAKNVFKSEGIDILKNFGFCRTSP